MGVSAQQILQSDPEYLQRQLFAQEQQRVNPTGGAAGALGALLGRGIGNITQGKGFFQAPDYGLQRVSAVQGIMKSVEYDPNNPQSYYEQVGRLLQDQGYSDLAPLAFGEANKLKTAQSTMRIQEEKLTLDKKKLDADLEREKRQGRLTDAQIREIDARIANMGSSYEYQVIKGPAGETTAILAINKKNPTDVKQIPLGDSAAPPPAAAGNDVSAQAKAELERRRNAK